MKAKDIRIGMKVRILPIEEMTNKDLFGIGEEIVKEKLGKVFTVKDTETIESYESMTFFKLEEDEHPFSWPHWTLEEVK
jgi:hypothetical protein